MDVESSSLGILQETSKSTNLKRIFGGVDYADLTHVCTHQISNLSARLFFNLSVLLYLISILLSQIAFFFYVGKFFLWQLKELT
jgi:hypothetical protein